ncbi:c-type cytochrome [Marinigracilibium pacificum]|uniref:C-type cytochrome n=1 Tax=Marinigracilibium pacificum TaxID=2729599 RepID=A0A848IVA6_9BACT|nr:c-type cytochrome [Marinigracilibium pacificum]NMM48267.1 c-type cytochrome [Marinigracilibium pacificum]
MNIEKLISKLSIILLLLVSGVIIVFTILEVAYIKPDLFKSKAIVSNSEIKSIESDLPSGKIGQEIKYGYLLISQSSKYMGSEVSSESLRYSGNNLSCTNCHLEGGTKAGAASWVGISKRYPQFRGRENKVSTLEERVNGCMERSMNGIRLPEDSPQMEAIISYMNWLSEGVSDSTINLHKGFANIILPDFKADTLIGKTIYKAECQVCHGENGEGIKSNSSTKYYEYPPLWGDDTYNHGAGMNRLLTAAAFIKGNMPFGQATLDNPKLSDEEAIHVAAYINKFNRPIKENTINDFPDLKLKPVSTPYGPWDDDFDSLQHKYGPFKPIADYYQAKYKIKKTK